MRVLTITGLFPSRVAPTQGVFLLQRIRAVRDEGAAVRVLAPVPYVPPGPVPARYARVRATPDAEEIDGLAVRHPRYFMVPKVGMYWQDRAYARGLARALREEVERFRPDLLDVHYLYPDACAVARLARELGLPYVVTARGSDVKLLGRIPLVARRIRRALQGAAGVAAVSRDLAATMRELGFGDRDVEILPNGVDPDRFHPRNREAARAALGLPLEGRRIVCVGSIAPVHGQELLLEMLAHEDAPADVEAYLVGGGGEALRGRIAELGLDARVHLVGAVPHARVPLWYAAADASVHPGRWAGCPNAVLESLACGTRCLASDLPEMREVIPSPAEGLLAPRDPGAFARTLETLLECPQPIPPATPRTWAETARDMLAWMAESVGVRATAVR